MYSYIRVFIGLIRKYEKKGTFEKAMMDQFALEKKVQA